MSGFLRSAIAAGIVALATVAAAQPRTADAQVIEARWDRGHHYGGGHRYARPHWGHRGSHQDHGWRRHHQGGRHGDYGWRHRHHYSPPAWGYRPARPRYGYGYGYGYRY